MDKSMEKSVASKGAADMEMSMTKKNTGSGDMKGSSKSRSIDEQSIKSSVSKATTSNGREKSRSKERIGIMTPDKIKSPLISKKNKDKEEKEALRKIEAQKELNRDIAMAIMVAALTPPRRKRSTATTNSVKVSLVPEDELSEHQCSAQLSISMDTPEMDRKRKSTMTLPTSSLNNSMSNTPETSRKGYGSYEVLNLIPKEVLFPPEDGIPPPSNLVWAVLSCILCPWMACCGVTAIQASRESQRSVISGNLKDARHHSERAKLCAGITFFVGITVFVIGAGFVFSQLRK